MTCDERREQAPPGAADSQAGGQSASHGGPAQDQDQAVAVPAGGDVAVKRRHARQREGAPVPRRNPECGR